MYKALLKTVHFKKTSVRYMPHIFPNFIKKNPLFSETSTPKKNQSNYYATPGFQSCFINQTSRLQESSDNTDGHQETAGLVSAGRASVGNGVVAVWNSNATASSWARNCVGAGWVNSDD